MALQKSGIGRLCEIDVSQAPDAGSRQRTPDGGLLQTRLEWKRRRTSAVSCRLPEQKKIPLDFKDFD